MTVPQKPWNFLVAPVLVPLAWTLCGCTRECPCQNPPPFGGTGAEVGPPDVQPLTDEDNEPRVTGACAAVPPPGTDVLLEDFEDGDNQLFKTYHREGWWFTATDGTESGKVLPPKSGFAPSALPQSLATGADQMAAHFVAPKMTDWGVSWGTTLRWIRKDLSCPFNASAFEGVEFWAKGPGTVRLKIGTSATVPPDFGGICKKECWDMHMHVVRLEEGWHRYVVPWETLQQGGWGTDARFDSKRLLTLNWTVGPEDLPVDFWIDDVRFWSAELEEEHATEQLKVPHGAEEPTEGDQNQEGDAEESDAEEDGDAADEAPGESEDNAEGSAESSADSKTNADSGRANESG